METSDFATNPALSDPSLLSVAGVDFSRRTFLRGVAGAALVGGGAELLSGCTGEDVSRLEPLPDCKTADLQSKGEELGPDGLLMTSERWRLAGVEAGPDGLRVGPAPITIVNKNEQALTEKPENAQDIPVLPFETSRYFLTGGGMRIDGELVLNNAQTKASVLVAETLPLTYDEFQFLPGNGVRLTLSAATGSLEIWDGKHKDPQTIVFPVDATDSATLARSFSMTRNNGHLLLMVDGRQIADPVPFAGNKIWMGLEARDGSFAIPSLIAKPLDGETTTIVDAQSQTVEPCSDGLRTLAERRYPHCTIGTAVALSPMCTDSEYAALLAGNFNSMTTENALKPQFVQPQEGVFRTEEMQQIFEFALKHNMKVHGHALVPNRSLPKWMRDLPLSRVRQVMVDHITGVIERIGRVPNLVSIDVVNEPLDGEEWRKSTIWHQAMGDQCVDIALEAAHAAAQRVNPGLVLVVNENSTDKDSPRDEARFNLLLTKLIAAKKKGINVAMGFEGHVYQLGRDEMSPSDLERRMAILNEHGILARVSEMDVTTRIDGKTTNEGLRTQAEQFGEIAAVCMKAPNCISFTMWGVGGKYVSTAGTNKNGELSWSSYVVWDENMRQRPAAYRALREALGA